MVLAANSLLTSHPVWGILWANRSGRWAAVTGLGGPDMAQNRPLRTAKFLDEEVIALRDRAARQERTVREEAEIFGVPPETIRKILRRDTYTHVGGGGYRGPIAATVKRTVEETLDREALESQEKLMRRLAAEIKRVPQADALVKELQAGPTETAAEKIKRLEGQGSDPLDEA